MAKTNLPPGFRFHPTDVELVWYYLKRKVMGKPFRSEAISEVELYKFAPWELPEKSRLRTRDLEWYFFCHRDKKYSNGSRSNRATDGGYWKATGKDKSVIHNSCTVGMRRTLVFHEGKPPKGTRTNWVMYEYRLQSRELVDAGFAQVKLASDTYLKDAYLLCKVFQKSGLGPRIGEQYGAPFNEEDWEDDTAIESSFPLPCVSSCLSAEPLDNQAIQADPVSKQPIASSAVELLSDHDLLDVDGISLEELAEFLNSSPLVENADGKMPDLTIPSMNVNEAAAMDPEGVYNELDDLSTGELISGNIDLIENILNETALCPTLQELDSKQYVELNDLIGDGNPYVSVEPSTPFAPNPSGHWPDLENLNHILDPIPYFDNDVYGGMHGLPHTGPDTTSQHWLPGMQIGDFGEFVPPLERSSF
nr:PREDICTED: NAC domain-containing protein 82-like isoform X1 [Musa acuminata subsp. malaccensis]